MTKGLDEIYEAIKNIFSSILWALYDYSCIRLMVHWIHPPRDERIQRRPSSFLLRLASTYLIIYGLAISRYELSVARIEAIYSSLVEESVSTESISSVQAIVDLQTEPFPEEPRIDDFESVLSVFSTDKSTYSPLKTRVPNLVSRLLEETQQPQIDELRGRGHFDLDSLTLVWARMDLLSSQSTMLTLINSIIDTLICDSSTLKIDHSKVTLLPNGGSIVIDESTESTIRLKEKLGRIWMTYNVRGGFNRDYPGEQALTKPRKTSFYLSGSHESTVFSADQLFHFRLKVLDSVLFKSCHFNRVFHGELMKLVERGIARVKFQDCAVYKDGFPVKIDSLGQYK